MTRLKQRKKISVRDSQKDKRKQFETFQGIPVERSNSSKSFGVEATFAEWPEE